MYQMAKKHCRKFQPAEQGARTLQTDDRQTTDGRQHIANVNVSSRSLKMQIAILHHQVASLNISATTLNGVVLFSRYMISLI